MKNQPPRPPQTTFSNLSNDVPLRIRELSEPLLDVTGGWPKTVNGVLSYPQGDGLGQLMNEAQLFAYIDQYARVIWSRTGIPKREFFEGLKLIAPSFQWATPYPHYPEIPGVLYLRERPAPAQTGRLDELIGRFNPATPLDAELLKAAFVTPAAGLSPGKRPSFVITSVRSKRAKGDPQRGRGTGKTTAVAAIGLLYGGTFRIRSSANPDRMMSDLLSPSAFPLRIGELDNLKSYRFSSDWFEALLTAREFSGHLLYHGHASRPNYVTFFVTVNGASFSKDMSQRSVVIQLSRPQYAANWWRGTERLIREHRDEIFADIGWFLSQTRKPIKRVIRWDEWCNRIVRRLHHPDNVFDLIIKHQGDIDEDDATAEDVVDYFEARIWIRAARQLGWDEIDAIVREELADDPNAAEEHFINDNVNRRQLSTMGKARCVARLSEIEFGGPISTLRWSKKEKAKADIAIRMGCVPRTVNRLLLALAAPREIHIAIDREYLSMVDGGKVSLLDPKQQESLASQLRKIYSNNVTTEKEKRSLVQQVVKAKTLEASTPQKAMKDFQKLLRTICKDVQRLEHSMADLPKGYFEQVRPQIGNPLNVLSRLHDSPTYGDDPEVAGLH